MSDRRYVLVIHGVHWGRCVSERNLSQGRADSLYGLSVVQCFFDCPSALKDNLLDEYMSTLPSLTATSNDGHVYEG